jgi:hypothetical protein
MTRPRRGGWRWCGKWATLTLAATIAVAWFVSGWWYAGLACGSAGTFALYVGEGYLQCLVSQVLIAEPGLHWGRCANGAPHWNWWLWYDLDPSASDRFLDIRIPLWALFLPLGATAAWLWRLDRKPKPGRCPRCRYDLFATPPTAPCPECGEGGRAQQRPNAQAAEPAARTTP